MADQRTVPRKAVTLYLQPELRDRLDSAYYKLKAKGSRISRPEFCEAIIEAGLNQFDAMPDKAEMSGESASYRGKRHHRRGWTWQQ